MKWRLVTRGFVDWLSIHKKLSVTNYLKNTYKYHSTNILLHIQYKHFIWLVHGSSCCSPLGTPPSSPGDISNSWSPLCWSSWSPYVPLSPPLCSLSWRGVFLLLLLSLPPCSIHHCSYILQVITLYSTYSILFDWFICCSSSGSSSRHFIDCPL